MSETDETGCCCMCEGPADDGEVYCDDCYNKLCFRCGTTDHPGACPHDITAVEIRRRAEQIDSSKPVEAIREDWRKALEELEREIE